jgi:hypothetical protein
MTQLRMNSSKSVKQTNKQNKTWKGRKGHHKTTEIKEFYCCDLGMLWEYGANNCDSTSMERDVQDKDDMV